MFNVHLRPDVFPIETSIFTGKITEEKLRTEHQLEWEKLISRKESGENGSSA